jgi:hypothetical protein
MRPGDQRWQRPERIDHCSECGAENPEQGPDLCPECGATGSLISTWGAAQAERYRTGARYSTRIGETYDVGARWEQRIELLVRGRFVRRPTVRT